MQTGEIKWFSPQIGAGFIRSDEGDNVFFRSSAFHSNDPKTMRRGQRVSYAVAKDFKNRSTTTAAKVKPLLTIPDCPGD